MRGQVIRKGANRRFLFLCPFLLAFLFLFHTPSYGAGMESVSPDGQAMPSLEDSLSQYDFADIEKYLSDKKEELGWNLSFTDLMKDLMTGDFAGAAGNILDTLKQSLLSEVRYNGSLMVQILILGIVGAVFTNFSSVFSGSQISETGFFVTYLLMFTFLAASFFSSIEVANRVLSQIVDFMKVILPAYFLAAAFAGGSVSALASYEFTLFSISLVQWSFFKVIVPVIRVYVLLVLAGHISKEDILSKLTDLLKVGLEWGLKTLLGLVLGFQLIQGMVLPYVDSIKNTSVQKFLQVIPGVGQGINAVAQVVLGSGVLIKNTMGAAVILILILLSAVPLLKLLILMVMYQIVAAALQPVCDKRLISCISSVAYGHKMLLSVILAALVLFVITIAVICNSTNVMYYTG